MPRMLAAAAALAFAGVVTVEAAVIGIDLGGEFLKASLVKPRVPLDIVLNPEGKRRSEAIVGMFDGEQAYGGAALNQVRARSARLPGRAASAAARRSEHLPALPPFAGSPAIACSSNRAARATSCPTSRCWWAKARSLATCSG